MFILVSLIQIIFYENCHRDSKTIWCESSWIQRNVGPRTEDWHTLVASYKHFLQGYLHTQSQGHSPATTIRGAVWGPVRQLYPVALQTY